MSGCSRNAGSIVCSYQLSLVSYGYGRWVDTVTDLLERNAYPWSTMLPIVEVTERFRSRGYLVKGFPYTLCLADCIRVTLGPPWL